MRDLLSLILTEDSLLFLWEAALLSSFETGFVPRDQEEEAIWGRPGVTSPAGAFKPTQLHKTVCGVLPCAGHALSARMQTEHETSLQRTHHPPCAVDSFFSFFQQIYVEC